MTYTFNCSCGYVSKVEANDDDEAATLLVADGKKHLADTAHQPELHAGMPQMSDEEMAAMVRQGMKKEGW